MWGCVQDSRVLSCGVLLGLRTLPQTNMESPYTLNCEPLQAAVHRRVGFLLDSFVNLGQDTHLQGVRGRRSGLCLRTKKRREILVRV